MEGCLTKMLKSVISVFIMMVVSTLIGLITGWLVGLFFGDTILTFLACLGIKGLKMWQIGASLGFIGSFFRNVSLNNHNSK